METNISKFKFSRYFNYLNYLGIWNDNEQDPWTERFHYGYRMICFVVLFSSMGLQLADLYLCFGNISKMAFNLCTSAIVIGTITRIGLLLNKKEVFHKLRNDLWKDYYKYNELEDEIIKDWAYKNLQFLSKMLHISCFIFFPLWIAFGYFSYLWGPRELPFPAYMPINMEDSVQYNIIICIEIVFGAYIITVTIEFDLMLFSLKFQIGVQYKILSRTISRLDRTCKDDNDKLGLNENLTVHEDAYTVEQKKRKIKWIMWRQSRIMEYVKAYDSVVKYMYGVKLFWDSMLIIMNGLQVLKMTDKFSGKICYQLGYLALIIIDMCYMCRYASMLTTECQNVGFAAYSIAWYETDVSSQKNILMMILRSQKPPKITAANIFSMNLHTFLGVLKNTYSWLMLFRQLELK